MPLSPDNTAICQACGVELKAEGEGIHGRDYHHHLAVFAPAALLALGPDAATAQESMRTE